MEIKQHSGTLSILGLRELTGHNAPIVRERVSGLLTEGLKIIEVDLSQASVVDSCGLAMLMSIYKAANRQCTHGGTVLRLLSPQPPVQQVIELTRMHHLFEIVFRRDDSPARTPSLRRQPRSARTG